MNIGIDHGYSAVKTRHFSFPAGISAYSYEPYTLQNTLEYGGQYFVCGTGRQPILRNKTENRNYYLLTLAAIAKEIRQRGEKTECSVTIGAGLPLTLFGREKKAFREYLLYPEKPGDSMSPVCFKFEGVPYRITVQDVKLFPQGYSALAVHPELLRDEPSVLLMDIGGWTVDLMRLDKGIPDASTCRSLELGMIRCVDEIREQVRRDTGLSLTDAQTERILSGKLCSLPEETRAIVRRQGRLYTERLFSAVTEAGFDCRALPVILMGGGASLVKKSVEPQDGLCRAIYLTDDKLNAEGFERILEQMSGEVKKVWQGPNSHFGPICRRRTIDGHGKFCRLFRSGKKAPFLFRPFSSVKMKIRFAKRVRRLPRPQTIKRKKLRVNRWKHSFAAYSGKSFPPFRHRQHTRQRFHGR